MWLQVNETAGIWDHDDHLALANGCSDLLIENIGSPCVPLWAWDHCHAI